MHAKQTEQTQMGTRSTIALEYADGTVDQIYCHWDGYLSHNGRILSEHYMDPFKVQQLMALGSLSSLGSELTPPPGNDHSFDNPHPGVCVAYGRDRGETDVDATRFDSFEMYRFSASWQEYDYVLRCIDGKPVWFVARSDGQFRPLESELTKESQ